MQINVYVLLNTDGLKSIYMPLNNVYGRIFMYNKKKHKLCTCKHSETLYLESYVATKNMFDCLDSCQETQDLE